jgi:hypothetical protein
MLQYEGENHGLAKAENLRDYSVRMREFFDHHLQGAPAPDWLENGVKRLDLERHLEERARAIAPAPAPPAGAGKGATRPAGDRRRRRIAPTRSAAEPRPTSG